MHRWAWHCSSGTAKSSGGTKTGGVKHRLSAVQTTDLSAADGAGDAPRLVFR